MHNNTLLKMESKKPVTMIAGFCFGITVNPATVQTLKNMIIPLTFLMVYPMMVTLNINNLKDGIKNVRLQGVTQLINFSLIPLLAFGLGRIFFTEQPYLALGLLLAALLPTSGMTISWTGFARGNMGAAINMTVIGLTLGSLTTPFYVRGLMGADAALVIAAAYIIQVQAAAWYVRLTDRLFGLPATA